MQRHSSISGGPGPAAVTGAPKPPGDAGAVIARLIGWLDGGVDAAMATVVSTWGSSPRPVGSHLGIDADGNMTGSVSGGCIEGAVVKEGIEAMQTGRPRLVEFGVTDDMAWESGLACGGRVRVFVEPFAPWRQLWAEAGRALAGHRACVVSTRLDDGRKALYVDGETPGGLEVSDTLLRGMLNALEDDLSAIFEDGGGDHFLRVYAPPRRLIVIGAVHIAQFLAPMAELAGFSVVLVDPRRAFAAEPRFPGFDVRNDWPDEALAELALDRRSAVVVLTHDPKLDDPALTAALASDAFYIGALGSRRTHAQRLERLIESGAAPRSLDRIHGPIGCDIGAVSAAEIAVSIMAEIVSSMRQGRAP